MAQLASTESLIYQAIIPQQKHRYDLFVSYVDADRDWVEGYLIAAMKAANVCYIHEDAFALGKPRGTEFSKTVTQSERTLLVISPDYLEEDFNEYVEFLAQTYSLQKGTWQVIPLLLRLVDLPPHLEQLTRLDATNPDEWDDVIARLCREIGKGMLQETTKPICPYPGIASFRTADRQHFHGRSQQVRELLNNLRFHPFMAVIVPSGSGKSSLVAAGLIPALETTTLPELAGNWAICTMRPGVQLLTELRKTVASQIDVKNITLYAQTAEGNTGHILLFVDQFEETFARAAQQKNSEAESFLKRLDALIKAQVVSVVLTVRADFYADLMTSPLWLHIRDHRLEVLLLDEVGLREAIERPAISVGVKIAPALVDALVRDAAGEPGVLPLCAREETLVLLSESVQRRYLPLTAYEVLHDRQQLVYSDGQDRTGYSHAG